MLAFIRILLDKTLGDVFVARLCAVVPCHGRCSCRKALKSASRLRVDRRTGTSPRRRCPWPSLVVARVLTVPTPTLPAQRATPTACPTHNGCGCQRCGAMPKRGVWTTSTYCERCGSPWIKSYEEQDCKEWRLARDTRLAVEKRKHTMELMASQIEDLEETLRGLKRSRQVLAEEVSAVRRFRLST